MRRWPALCGVIALAFAQQALAAPPEARVQRLARGVNVPHWFWYPADDSTKGRERYLSAADVTALKSAGFTHVRIPLEPGWVWDDRADQLRSERLAEYRRAMDLFTAQGLAVVVDIHPAQTAWLAKVDDASVGELEKLWKALGAAMSATDPDLVVLELMNEPHDLRDPAIWNGAQARLVKAVRAAAPLHTVLCTGDSWGGIDGLRRCTPVADDNVIYSFHFYDPHNFTHQGAAWGFDAWKDMANVPYPATPEELRAVAAGFKSQRAREVLEWSAKNDPWTGEALKARIAGAAAWAREHKAAVYCGEFGVYRPKAPAEARGRWLAEVTGALESHKIGWAMWDYAGGFALTEGKPGERTIDPGTLEALGLKRK